MPASAPRHSSLAQFQRLLLLISLALAGCRPSGSLPAGSGPGQTVPPDARVIIVKHGAGVMVVSDAVPTMYVGDTRVELFGPAIDGIRLDADGLSLPAAQLARLDGEFVAVSELGLVGLYGPLDSRRIERDEHGRWVLHIDQNLLETLRRHEDALRRARSGVAEPQAGALLDQAIAGLVAARDPATWRDTLRLHPDSGAQVFAGLQSAEASLQELLGDPTQPPRFREALGDEGLARVSAAAITVLFVGQCLARAAYEDAEAHFVPPGVLARAEAAGNAAYRARNEGRLEEPVQHYLAEWQIAVWPQRPWP